MYRRTGRKVGGRAKGGSSVLLLTVAGRRSGMPHTVPVAYVQRDGAYYLAATAGASQGASVGPQPARRLHGDHRDRPRQADDVCRGPAWRRVRRRVEGHHRRDPPRLRTVRDEGGSQDRGCATDTDGLSRPGPVDEVN
ncbi:DUF385 domain-containing protein [Intrasporangium calvum]|nr:DUF385 domain-containing protein [Intrasporangium calvum]